MFKDQMIDEARKTEIHCLFKREPRPLENVSRSHTIKSLNQTNNVGFRRISSNSITHLDNEIANNSERNIRDNSIYIYVHKKKRNSRRKRREYNVYQYTKDEIIFLIDTKRKKPLPKHYSLFELSSNNFIKNDLKQAQSSKIMQPTKNKPYSRNYIVNNCCRSCDKPECGNPFANPSVLAKVYRCQMATEDNCCCCCNSDAIFEVMKSLYDCYKKKNCENCTCILCGFVKQKKSVGVGEEEVEALTGKPKEEQEKIIREMVAKKLPLPEGKTPSEKKLVDKVRQELSLPPEPKTSAEKRKLKQAYVDGIITPLEGKTPEKKEKALKKMAEAGVPLPEGRTPTEKALIDKAKASSVRKPSGVPPKVPSEKIRKAKTEGFITPLAGKTPEQKDKILKGLATNGIPLPEGKTPSEKKLIDKVRKEMGLPPEPKTSKERKKLDKAYADGVVTPLEGKTPEQKEKALKRMAEAGVPLPEGRTPSEKALVDKIKTTVVKKPTRKPSKKPSGVPSEKIKKAKSKGFVTPLAGKTPKQKEKILRGLAKNGVPLPEGKTPSEKKLVDKVKQELGLPPEPKTSAEKRKLKQAYADGIITPLEGKTPEQKEKALKKMVEAGVPVPEGRTPSEKALIDKIKPTVVKRPSEVPSGVPSGIPSEKLRKAKVEGLITPLKEKTPDQKEKVLKGLAKHGIPLPEGKTPSEKKLVDKVRQELSLPPEPKTSAEKRKLKQAYADGIITPLEGKTLEQKEKTLKRMAEAGIPLPEGRTSSEKALIDKVKASSVRKSSGVPPKVSSEKIKKAKADGFITPLAGKTPEQKYKILKGLATNGIPLPEGKTPSEKKLIDKVRKEMGLPPEPKSSKERKILDKAYANGIITPLIEGKTPEQKEKALKRMAEAGVPLPEGRTPSEKALIDKIKATAVKKPSGVSSGVPPRVSSKVPSEKIKKAKAEGFITPLAGKTPEQKEKILKGLATNGIPLPEGKTPSEKKLIGKIRKEMGLPPEPKTSKERKILDKAYADGVITPLIESKTPEQKEKALKRMAEAGVPLPEGRTPSEKALIDKTKVTAVKKPSKVPSGVPSEKIKKAKAEGFLTPLAGKTPEQKERILKGLATNGIPLPEGKTPSEKTLIDKVRKEMGLPPEPKTSTEKAKLKHAYAQGLITPMEGKTPTQKENALRRMRDAGIPFPKGRTPSEQTLLDKIGSERPKTKPSERLRQAKEAGLLTPLKGKTREEKEKILKGLAELRHPLPEGKTSSEKALIDKVRKDMEWPSEQKTPSERIQVAECECILSSMEGKTLEQKETALRKMAKAGIPLPEGRTPSEKALIDKVKATTQKRSTEMSAGISSEKRKKAKAAGFITPLEGKTPEQKEKILIGMATNGIPLPEGKTSSDKKLIDKVRYDMGLPPKPKSSAEKTRLEKAYADGIISPLEGKTPEYKEKALKRMAEAGILLPEGRTTSEKALIDKVKATTVKRSLGMLEGVPSEKMRKAKAEGLITPLEGKTLEQKTKILQGLAKNGIPFPVGKTVSEKKLMTNIIREMGLPPIPKTASQKAIMDKAYADGIITPLEGKSNEDKEKVLVKMYAAGVPLPEGRNNFEKVLIEKIKTTTVKKPSGMLEGVPSEKMRKAKGEGLITPLEGKTLEQKTKILQGLAKNGIPFPVGKTVSEKKLMTNIIREMGLPPIPKTASQKAIMDRAYADGIITPLEGKSNEDKEKILEKMLAAGVPLPEGRTNIEKVLIEKVINKGPRTSEVKRQPKERKIGEKPHGIEAQELEEIKKTTRCDRACGCDRKKIRFKHSYVKIRVTTPDISSFCDCPEECIPGVKGGVFVDNEGIKVTIGFSSVPLCFQSKDNTKVSTVDLQPDQKFLSFCSAALGSDASIMKTPIDYSLKYEDKSVYHSKENSFKDINHNLKYIHSSEVFSDSRLENYELEDNTIITDYSSIYMISSKISRNTDLIDDNVLSNSSYDSIVLLRTESSLSFSIGSRATELATISVISLDSSIISVLSNGDMSTDFSNSILDIESVESEIRNIDSNITSSTDSIQPYIVDKKNSFFNNEQVTILRYTRTKKKNKTKDKKGDKKVTISEPKCENIMKIVAKEILNQTQKSDSSSVFVVMQSDEYDTNASLSSELSHGLKKDDQKYTPRESYPIVTSEHQLLVASRGVKLTTMPKDFREMVPVNEKTQKTKQIKEQDISNSKNKIDHLEKEVKKKAKNEKRLKYIKSFKIKNTGKNIPHAEAPQVCSYHKLKIPEKSDKPKQRLLGFHTNVQSKAEIGPRKSCEEYYTPTTVHQIIETTRSLTLTCQKAIEVTPQYALKELDTSCDRPCSCEAKTDSPGLSEIFDKPTTKLTADTFVRNSIPYLYQTHRLTSPHSSPSDAESCKCSTKWNPNTSTTQQSQRVSLNEYNTPDSAICVDYGEPRQQIISMHASSSDLLPCACAPVPKKCEKHQHKTERQEFLPRAELSEEYSFYAKQQQTLKNIQKSFHQKFREQFEKQKHVEVTPQMNYQIPPEFSDENYKRGHNAGYQEPIASPDVNYKNIRSNVNPIQPQTDEHYISTTTEYQIIPDDNNNLCPECFTIHGNKTAKDYDNTIQYNTNNDNNMLNEFYMQDVPNANFLGQYPEFLDITADSYIAPETDYNVVHIVSNEETNFYYTKNYTKNIPESANITDEYLKSTSNNSDRNQINNVNYSHYSTQCPKCMNKSRPYHRNDHIKDNLISLENSSHNYGEMKTRHLSQAFIARVPEIPREPPPTRKNTLMGEIYDQDSYIYKNYKLKGERRVKLIKGDHNQYKMREINKKPCNECCVQGKITDCVNPGKLCDPCKRFRQSPLPVGFKLSNTQHSKLHLNDLMIYEDSSHKCCCLPRPEKEDKEEEVDECKIMIRKCMEYCSGSSVENIRDAVLKFMKARELGIVYDTKAVNKKNICDQTRELCQGIEKAIAEREKCCTKVPRSISDYSIPPPPENNYKCWCPTNKNSNNCMCPKPVMYEACLQENPKPSCQQSYNLQDTTTQKYPEPTLLPFLDIHLLGLREISRRRQTGPPKDPGKCECRAPKNGKPPLENCVCPKYERCACPPPTEEQWIDYFCECLNLTQKEAIKLLTEQSQTTSGFKFMKRRKVCNEIITLDEALDFFAQHEGFVTKSGQIKANPDGTCPGCGDLNCPGLWKPHFFDPNTFDPNALVQDNMRVRFSSRYATESDQECWFPNCEDKNCPGMGPYGLLPPIPGGPVSDVEITGEPERGPHKACVCEPIADFEKDTYCPPDGPVLCECAKGSNVNCECWPEKEGNEGESKGEDEKEASEAKIAEEKSAVDDLKVRDWDKGPCAPVGGFKLTLGCKGAGTTGLKGICCFNAWESYSEKSLKSASSASSTYLLYL